MKPAVGNLAIAFVLLVSTAWSQNPPVRQTIALTNHVRYKNGDTFVHPSFKYAGTGFVVDIDGNKYAVSAKHILWVARNRRVNNVSVNTDLQYWIMRSKGGADSVVVNRLINEDTTEVLEGSSSTIMERDLIAFSIKTMTPGIQALTPRFSEINPGEVLHLIGNPYHESGTVVRQTKFVRKLGLDLLIEQAGDEQYSGFSGSPVVDDSGRVVGIFSSTASDPVTGRGVIVLTSMEYLKKALAGQRGLNTPKEDYGQLILAAVLKKGAKAGIRLYQELIANPDNYYKYNLRSANRNGLRESGERLLDMSRFKDAVAILEFNAEVNSSYFYNYNVLGKAYLKAGNKAKAIENFRISTSRYGDRNDNDAFAELEKLGFD